MVMKYKFLEITFILMDSSAMLTISRKKAKHNFNPINFSLSDNAVFWTISDICDI